MAVHHLPPRLELAPREVRSVREDEPLTLECREGAVWVTIDHDTRDFVLEAGESLALAPHARALVSALRAARVDVRPALEPQPCQTPQPRARSAMPSSTSLVRASS